MVNETSTRSKSQMQALVEVGAAVVTAALVILPPVLWAQSRSAFGSTSSMRSAQSTEVTQSIAALERRLERIETISRRSEAIRPTQTGPAVAASRSELDDFERRLKALYQYVKDVERSIATIDASVSTPAVLEQKLEQQKSLVR